MSLRSRAAILAIAVGLSTVSVAQAAQVANGLTINGLSANGLTANGLTANGLTANGLTINGKDVQGHVREASSGTIRLKAVILQDGSAIELQ
jgi:GLTT repeat (6 copies)